MPTMWAPSPPKKWEKDSQALLSHMRTRREVEWLGIKELWPLDFMGYVATTFKEVTGHVLPGLKDFTSLIRARGYYHWRVAELRQVNRCLHLKGLNKPAGPQPRPSFSTPPSVPPSGKAPHQEAPPSASGDQLIFPLSRMPMMPRAGTLGSPLKRDWMLEWRRQLHLSQASKRPRVAQ